MLDSSVPSVGKKTEEFALIMGGEIAGCSPRTVMLTNARVSGESVEFLSRRINMQIRIDLRENFARDNVLFLLYRLHKRSSVAVYLLC